MVNVKLTAILVSVLSFGTALLNGIFIAAGDSTSIQGTLLYRTAQTDTFDLYLMDVGRGLSVNLSNTDSNETASSWSPNGQQIVYVSGQDAESGIYFMQPESRQITRLPTNALTARSPTVSPDGQQIAYIAVTSNTRDLLVSYRDGSDIRKLSFFGTYNDILGWIDDEHLAFESNTLDSRKIYITHTHRHDIEEIQRETLDDIFHDGSPDGRHQVTAQYHNGQRDLLVSSETAQYAITNHIEHDWSPDSRFVAFVSDRDGNAEIYVMNADGTNLRRLTYTPEDELGITWRPAQK